MNMTRFTFLLKFHETIILLNTHTSILSSNYEIAILKFFNAFQILFLFEKPKFNETFHDKQMEVTDTNKEFLDFAGNEVK